MTYAAYESCTRCASGPKPGTVALMKYTLEKFSYARSMGIFNCRNARGTGTLSIHACGRALDVGIPTIGGRANPALGNPIVQFFDKYSTEFGIHGQIYNRVRYDLRTPKGRAYGGVHPHYDHDHVEMRNSTAVSLTYAKIVSIAGPTNSTPNPPSGGFDMLAPCKKGDKGEHVEALQIMLSSSGFDPGDIDGVYGPATSSALLACRKAQGSGATSGDVFDGHAYDQLHRAHSKRWSTGTKGAKGDKGDKGDTGAKGAKGDKGDKGDPGPKAPNPKSASFTY